MVSLAFEYRLQIVIPPSSRVRDYDEQVGEAGIDSGVLFNLPPGNFHSAPPRSDSGKALLKCQVDTLDRNVWFPILDLLLLNR